ncbi:hypothetical protein SESBI_26229 [Sesbania bispinosa]|nr:hypothetical protein SESBI_26229 [Sesbania bispinosa]
MAMTTGCFHTVNNLCGCRENWRMRLKVVRVWNMCTVAKPDDPFATQMVFIDGEGGRIEVTVPKQHMQKFAKSVVEGEIYMVTNFRLNRNSGRFRACGHDYRMVFHTGTKVLRYHNISIPVPGFCFLKTSEIKKTHGRSDYLLDFIGDGSLRRDSAEQRGEGRHKVCNIRDNGGHCGGVHVSSSLWTSGSYHIVRKGEVGIQNVMNASKILWNPDITEAIEFKNGLVVHEVETDIQIGTISDRGRPASIKDEFLKLYPRKFVSDLLHTNEDGCFIILATIDEVLQDSLWWYMACKCMKAVSYDDNVPYCEDCDVYVYDSTPRYKVKMVVSDGSDSYNWSSPYPSAIMNLIGNEFLFRVEVKDDAIFLFDECFRVRRVSAEPNHIQEYSERVDEETPLELQFAPTFSKIVTSEGSSSAMQVSPNCEATATEIDVSPISTDPSPSVVEDSGSATKREPDQAAEPANERKKWCRLKPVNVEKN